MAHNHMDHGMMATTMGPHMDHNTSMDPHMGHVHNTTMDPHMGHHTTMDPHAGHGGQGGVAGHSMQARLS
ncbi:hypothetical protein BaRGS_00021343 [Batillaria attramentaria]|uniref:Uncharacterized protein n=1 Tax=Batillaria attramentaria TaxID=370345 RepID=A0ABD0KJU9_9CAEN